MDKSKRDFLKKSFLGLGTLGLSLPLVNALQGINFSNGSYQSISGKVLQILQTTKTDTSSITGTTFTDLTGMSITITPSNVNSKILIFVSMYVGTDSVTVGHTYVNLLRGNTEIIKGDIAGSRTSATAVVTPSSVNTLAPLTINYIDSPNTTSATTYKLQWRTYSSGTAYLNRTGSDSDSDGYSRSISTITVVEIAQ